MEGVKKRYKEWVDTDTIGYATVCNCGEIITGWSPQEADENWEKHECQIKQA